MKAIAQQKSPSPRPSPKGRGRRIPSSAAQPALSRFRFESQSTKPCAFELTKDQLSCSLSQWERVGVRGILGLLRIESKPAEPIRFHVSNSSLLSAFGFRISDL